MLCITTENTRNNQKPGVGTDPYHDDCISISIFTATSISIHMYLHMDQAGCLDRQAPRVPPHKPQTEIPRNPAWHAASRRNSMCDRTILLGDCLESEVVVFYIYIHVCLLSIYIYVHMYMKKERERERERERGLNNCQGHVGICLKYLVLWLYSVHATIILVITIESLAVPAYVRNITSPMRRSCWQGDP